MQRNGAMGPGGARRAGGRWPVVFDVGDMVMPTMCRRVTRGRKRPQSFELNATGCNRMQLVSVTTFLFSHVFTCFHNFSHVFTCFHMFSHVFTIFHIFSHVFTCFHNFSHVFTCFHMFSHVFTIFHMFSHVFTCFHGWQDMEMSPLDSDRQSPWFLAACFWH